MSHSIKELRNLNPMWVYEHNYITLLKLFPFLVQDNQDEVYYINRNSELRIKIQERCKYTNIINIEQKYKTVTKYLKNLNFTLRIYYDANLTEVISYQDLSRLLPEYDYPNKYMYQPDEKHQANILLYDWLTSIISGRYQTKDEFDCSSV